MRLFKFRSRRIKVQIDIEVYLKNRTGGVLDKTRLPATIINISKGGACIALERVDLNGQHVFFTAMEGKDNHLYLGNVPCENGSADIAGTTIWMDSVNNRQKRFHLGIKFLEQQKKLLGYLKKRG